MTIHYHGTPITPRSVLQELSGKCFCVSFASPNDCIWAHEHGQSVMLDNGAFSVWRRGISMDWSKYYAWSDKWLEYPTTWAVIPDVIDGGEAENDAMLKEWPNQKGAPVWHLHESIGRLERLCVDYDKVCFGSSAEYQVVGSPMWHKRMCQAMNAICVNGVVPVWIHMLRGMAAARFGYPFASVDSTDIARNHHLKHNALEMANIWDSVQCKPRWDITPIQERMFA